jgi:HTH-type transcriptional regulator / antitoxin HigA
MTATAKTHEPRKPRKPRRAFDQRKYTRLLSRTRPAVIRTEKECQRIEGEILLLLKKGDAISAEEESLLDLLSMLVEVYENETEPEYPASPPDRMLRSIMADRDLKQSDLIDIFGSSGRASEAIRGKRAISKQQAVDLGKRFNVSAELFLPPARF